MGGDAKVLVTKSAAVAMRDENPLLVVESMVPPLEILMKAPPEGVPTEETPMEKT